MRLHLAVFSIFCLGSASAQAPSEIRFALRADPKTFDPLTAAEEPSETIRYLTGGVLIRFNRSTQQMEPSLAESWRVHQGGRRVDFVLRKNVRFSDGTPFGASDVVETVRRMTDPKLISPVADSFRGGSRKVHAVAESEHRVSVFFSAPISGVELLFDQLAISSRNSNSHKGAVLGPFFVAEHRAGHFVLLHRNPYYWQTDRTGRRLPLVDRIRIVILANRDAELLRFRRGELHLIQKLDPESFDRLRKESPSRALNAGTSLDSEFVWFNQTPGAPIPSYKQQWFQSKLFRQAVSLAINRADIVSLVYRGYARAANGPVSQSNKFWVNSALTPHAYDPDHALRLLVQDGFRLDRGALLDRDGNPVEFSLLTNSGSRVRSQIGTMIQEDLRRIGIRLTFVPLEFQSLIERISRTYSYESCLLGFTNVDIDPNGSMNVWMSSSTHHAWNPGQRTPATPWEAEVDLLMRKQASEVDPQRRKRAFDRVQEILAEESPMLFLVNPDVLVAVSESVRNMQPSPLSPHLYWNVEQLSLVALGQN